MSELRVRLIRMTVDDDQPDRTERGDFPISERPADVDALQVEAADELADAPVDETTIEDNALDESPADEASTDESLPEGDSPDEIPEPETVTAEDPSIESTDADSAVATLDEPSPVMEPAAEEAVRDEESAVDELIASYQSRMLDEEPEAEFVAHVEAKVPIVVPVPAPAVAEAVQEVEAIEEAALVVSPQPVILDLISCPVARSVQAESVPLSEEEQNSFAVSAPRTESVVDSKTVRSADPTAESAKSRIHAESDEAQVADRVAEDSEIEEPVAEWQPMPADQPAPVVPVVAYARRLLVETPDEDLSPLGFDDEATNEEDQQENDEVGADTSIEQPAEDAAQDSSDQQDDEAYEEDEVPEEEYEEAVVASDPDDDESDADLEPVSSGGGWTLPLLCIGIAVIACCMVIPQADANRRLAYERAALRTDLESIQTQVATNDEFLRKLASDPGLAERLAQRQLNLQRAGTKVLPIRTGDSGTSPFDLVQVPKPPKMEPYEPVGGTVAAICRDTRSRLYVMGVGLFILAAGLVLGFSPNPRSRD